MTGREEYAVARGGVVCTYWQSSDDVWWFSFTASGFAEALASGESREAVSGRFAAEADAALEAAMNDVERRMGGSSTEVGHGEVESATHDRLRNRATTPR